MPVKLIALRHIILVVMLRIVVVIVVVVVVMVELVSMMWWVVRGGEIIVIVLLVHQLIGQIVPMHSMHTLSIVPIAIHWPCMGLLIPVLFWTLLLSTFCSRSCSNSSSCCCTFILIAIAKRQVAKDQN